LIDRILTYCKAQSIVSMDNRWNEDCNLHEDYDQYSYFEGELKAYKSVIVFINSLMEKKNESS
jgi:hypothetical protein